MATEELGEMEALWIRTAQTKAFFVMRHSRGGETCTINISHQTTKPIPERMWSAKRRGMSHRATPSTW